MFPARAGMSRVFVTGQFLPYHVPRASGDEPLMRTQKPLTPPCSPRERG